MNVIIIEFIWLFLLQNKLCQNKWYETESRIHSCFKDNSSEPQFGEVKEILVTKQDTILLGLRLLLV